MVKQRFKMNYLAPITTWACAVAGDVFPPDCAFTHLLEEGEQEGNTSFSS